jgi:hypothetical protein
MCNVVISAARRAAAADGDGARSRRNFLRRAGKTVKVDAAYVNQHIGDLAKNADLSRFIL